VEGHVHHSDVAVAAEAGVAFHLSPSIGGFAMTVDDVEEHAEERLGPDDREEAENWMAHRQAPTGGV